MVVISKQTIANLAVQHFSQVAWDAMREGGDCWAACIKMAVAHWRGVVRKVDDISVLLPNDGGNWLKMTAVLRGLNIQCEFMPAQYVALDVIRWLQSGYPVIMGKRTGAYGFGHAVVVFGADENGLRYHDPARMVGNSLVKWGDFEKFAMSNTQTGIAITTTGRVSEPERFAVSARVLNVREKPNTLARVMGTMKAGQVIEVESAAWGEGYTWRWVVKAENPGLVGGWVAGKWLKDV